MLRGRNQFKVLQSIILAITIAVMNVFVPVQGPIQRDCHDLSMFGGTRITHPVVPIAMIDRTSASFSSTELLSAISPQSFIMPVAQSSCDNMSRTSFD